MEESKFIRGVETLSKYTNIPKRSLDTLVAQGKVPGRKIAGRWSFNKDDIDTWMREGDTGEVAHSKGNN